MEQKIYEFELWQPVSPLVFTRKYWNEHKAVFAGPLPALDTPRLKVAAYVNQGRWIAECPDRCGDAKIVSSRWPYYLCTNPACTSAEWYLVLFPPDKARIEAVLLRRPAKHPFYAANRNWRPGGTVADLIGENMAMGVER